MTDELTEQSYIPEKLGLNYKSYPEMPKQSPEITVREHIQDRVEVYRDVVLFMRNMELRRSDEAFDAYTQIFATIETALGTMRAYEWTLISGINPEFMGQQFTFGEAKLKAQEKYQVDETLSSYSDLIRGVAVLKGIYGDDLLLTPNLEAKVEDMLAETFTSNAIQYTKNRAEVQKAIEEDNVLYFAEQMYDPAYIATFSKYYRLGKYSDKFAYPAAGTGEVVYPHYYEVSLLETFLEEFTGNSDFGIARYDWNFNAQTDRHRLEEPGVLEMAKNSAQFRILRYNYRSTLLEQVREASADTENTQPEKMFVVKKWCALAEEQPEMSDTQLDILLAETLSQESGKQVKEYSVYAVRMSLNEGDADDTFEMHTFFAKKALGELITDPDRLAVKATELRELVLKVLNDYHGKGINVKDIALELDMPRSYLNGLKRVFEKLSAPKLGKRERSMKVVELFEQEVWPKRSSGELPAVLTEVASLYSASDINVSVSAALHTALERHPGLKLNHQEIRNVLGFLADKVPERIDYPEFRTAKQKYYLSRLTSIEEIAREARDELEANTMGSKVAEMLLTSLPVTLEHIALLRAYIDLKEAGRTSAEIGTELGYEEAQLRVIINGIIAEAKNLYGPIPDDQMDVIKRRLKESYADAN